MNHKQLTGVVILAAILTLLAYNLVMELNTTRHDTLSDVVESAIARDPMLVFAGGVLFGHLFWSGL
jgi:hypothetical protein